MKPIRLDRSCIWVGLDRFDSTLRVSNHRFRASAAKWRISSSRNSVAGGARDSAEPGVVVPGLCHGRGELPTTQLSALSYRFPALSSSSPGPRARDRWPCTCGCSNARNVTSSLCSARSALGGGGTVTHVGSRRTETLFSSVDDATKGSRRAAKSTGFGSSGIVASSASDSRMSRGQRTQRQTTPAWLARDVPRRCHQHRRHQA